MKMRKWFVALIGCLCFCINAYSLENDMRYSPKVLVFDFGKVVGGTDKKKLAEAISRDLHISAKLAKTLVDGYKKRTCSKTEFWKEWAEKKGISFPENWIDRFEELKLDNILPNIEVLKIIEELRSRGLKTAMLSNTTPIRAARIRSLGFYDGFEPVCLSCEIGASKPEKEAYEILLKAACVDAKDCLFIDDKEKNISAAQQLGFDAILFTTAEDLRKELENRSLINPEADNDILGQ